MPAHVSHPAQAMFPLMPREVFDTWLRPLIDANGWPFTSVSESLDLENWTKIFLDVPLSAWADLSWLQIDLAEHGKSRGGLLLHPDSIQLATQICVEFNNPGQSALIVPPQRCVERVAGHLAWIRGNNSFPGFVTAIALNGGWAQLVDGHHRMAAWLIDELPIQIPCWLAVRRA